MQPFAPPHQGLSIDLSTLAPANQKTARPMSAAFFTIRDAFISEPVVTFPRADRKFALISQVNLPNSTQEGCMSASLCQIDDNGSFQVLSHTSKQFHHHEANYPPFLQEIANAPIWYQCFRGISMRTTFHPLHGQLTAARTLSPPQEDVCTTAGGLPAVQLCHPRQNGIRSAPVSLNSFTGQYQRHGSRQPKLLQAQEEDLDLCYI